MTRSLRTFSQSLPMALLRTREAVMGRFRVHLNRHGVTEQQWRVLRALSALGDTTAAALAQATLIKAPSLTRILRDLETRRWIIRRASATDQRVTRVRLAGPGLAFLERAGPESEACYAAIAATVGRDRMARLYRILDEVHQRLDPPPPRRGSVRPTR